MIGTIVGRYAITGSLATGSLGQRWLAEDPVLGRSLVLTLLDPNRVAQDRERKKFLRSARAASALSHPGIARIYDAGEEDGRLYLASESLQGETVAQALRGGPFETARALGICRLLARAFEYAHGQGILVRSLDAETLVLEAPDRVVITDLGRSILPEDPRTTMTRGLPDDAISVPPEAIRGLELDARSDLYCLGAVLFEMLTGFPPFAAPDRLAPASFAELSRAIVEVPAQPPSTRRPGIPEDVDRLVLRLLAKTPEERPASATELLAELDRIDVRDREAGREAVRGRIAARHPSGALPSRPAITGKLIVVAGAILGLGLAWVSLHRSVLVRHDPAGGQPAVPQVARFESVAVLPFVPETAPSGEGTPGSAPAAQSALWAAGLSEGITTSLSGLRDLRVTPWVTAQGYDPRVLPPTVIGAELGVEAVVLGTFRLDSEVIDGSVRILDASTGEVVWSRRFVEPLADVFAVQSGIALDVGREIRGSLSGREEERLSHSVSSSVQAYELVLRGSTELSKQTREGNTAALAFFESALALDPEIVPALVGIGGVYMDRYFFMWEAGTGYLRAAEEKFRSALRIDPKNVRAIRGLLRVNGDLGAQLENLQIARRIMEDGDASTELLLAAGEGYWFAGLESEAVAVLRQVIERDPASQVARYFLVTGLTGLGRFEEALQAGEEYFLRFGEDAELHTWMGISAYALDRTEEARAHFERGAELHMDRSGLYLATFLFLEGEIERSRELSRSLGLHALTEGAVRENNRLKTQFLEQLWMTGQTETLRRLAREALAGGGPVDDLARHAWYVILAGDLDLARELVEAGMAQGEVRESRLYQRAPWNGFLELFEHQDHEDLRTAYAAKVEELRRRFGRPTASP